MTKISIIIPIFNEAETIANLLNYLLNNSSEKNISEIIIVDGGSNDGSQNIVDNFITSNYSEQRKENKNTRPDILFLNSDKGRAKQMNFGAKKANGTILYFLHADSFPPKDFDKLIIDEVKNGNLAGCFKMRFDSNHWWLKFISWFTKFSWPICRGGDQSLFITKLLFNDIDGYNERYIIYEDNILTQNLYALNQFKVIQKSVITSARKYEKHGVWKLQYHFFIIHLKHAFGKPPEVLYNYYTKHLSVK